MNWKSIVVITLVAILLGTASATVTFEKEHTVKHLAAPVALIQSGHPPVPNNASEPNAMPTAPDVEYTGIDISGVYGGIAFASEDRAETFSHASQATQDNYGYYGVMDQYVADGLNDYYAYFNGGEIGGAVMQDDPSANLWANMVGPTGQPENFEMAAYGPVDGDFNNWMGSGDHGYDHFSNMWAAGGVMGDLYYQGYHVADGKVLDADGHEHVYQAGYQDGQAGMSDVEETSGAMTSMDECDPVTAGDMAEVAAMAQG